jgi:hypothetical protein
MFLNEDQLRDAIAVWLTNRTCPAHDTEVPADRDRAVVFLRAAYDLPGLRNVESYSYTVTTEERHPHPDRPEDTCQLDLVVHAYRTCGARDDSIVELKLASFAGDLQLDNYRRITHNARRRVLLAAVDHGWSTDEDADEIIWQHRTLGDFATALLKAAPGDQPTAALAARIQSTLRERVEVDVNPGATMADLLRLCYRHSLSKHWGDARVGYVLSEVAARVRPVVGDTLPVIAASMHQAEKHPPVLCYERPLPDRVFTGIEIDYRRQQDRLRLFAYVRTAGPGVHDEDGPGACLNERRATVAAAALHMAIGNWAEQLTAALGARWSDYWGGWGLVPRPDERLLAADGVASFLFGRPSSRTAGLMVYAEPSQLTLTQLVSDVRCAVEAVRSAAPAPRALLRAGLTVPDWPIRFLPRLPCGSGLATAELETPRPGNYRKGEPGPGEEASRRGGRPDPPHRQRLDGGNAD